MVMLGGVYWGDREVFASVLCRLRAISILSSLQLFASYFWAQMGSDTVEWEML